jgi:hypothetical protein
MHHLCDPQVPSVPLPRLEVEEDEEELVLEDGLNSAVR